MRTPLRVVRYAAVVVAISSCDSAASRSGEATATVGQVKPDSGAHPKHSDAAEVTPTPDSPDAGRAGDPREVPDAVAAAVADAAALDAAVADASVDGELCWDAVLPELVLHSLGGEQMGVQGSYCAAALGANCSTCVDTDVEPEQYTIVHPEDELSVSMANGTLVAGTRCNPACPPLVRVQSVSCGSRDEVVIAFREDQPWPAYLGAGTYHVWVDSHFEADNGDTGQTYTGFGLIVSDSAQRGVTDSRLDAGCPP